MKYKLAASNIAWEPSDDLIVYKELKSAGFSGLEIAPTRFVKSFPYFVANVALAKNIARNIEDNYGFTICSIQSLWYGREENLFGAQGERDFLLNYTKSAINYSAALGCKHMVFGNPKNRNRPPKVKASIAIPFFMECAAHALKKNVVIGIEANPSSYGTNYLNSNLEVIELIKTVDSPALRLNLDLGAFIENMDDHAFLPLFIENASHVHISEPMLEPIIPRALHVDLKSALIEAKYTGWISLEMKKTSLSKLFASLNIVASTYS